MKNDEKKKNMTLGWKPEKGSLERKWKKFQRLTGKANKRMKSQQPGSIWSLLGFLNPFQNRRIWTFYPIMHFLNPRVYHGGSWHLSNCHIQRLEKMNLFKMLYFQRVHFSRKRFWKRATLFAQPNCENKSFEPDHRIPSQYPIQRFLIVIINFLRALSQKEDDFSRIINQVLKIFWFQALRKPHFENKFFFNKLCLHQSIRVMIYPQ